MQTAVEWLIDELMPSIALQTKYIEELKEQAKEMEKQQIMNAYRTGNEQAYIYEIAKQEYDNPKRLTTMEYWNKTYGSKGSDVAKRLIKEMPKHIADKADEYAEKLVKGSDEIEFYKKELEDERNRVASSQTEISDEEIEEISNLKYSDYEKILRSSSFSIYDLKNHFIDGMKFYREQLNLKLK